MAHSPRYHSCSYGRRAIEEPEGLFGRRVPSFCLFGALGLGGRAPFTLGTCSPPMPEWLRRLRHLSFRLILVRRKRLGPNSGSCLMIAHAPAPCRSTPFFRASSSADVQGTRMFLPH